MTLAAPPEGAPLENYANSVATAGQRHDQQDFRTARWVARGALWRETSLHRVRQCGRVVVSGDGHVQVRRTDTAVGYAGLASCGSVWACPVCNSKIQARRRLEVGAGITTGLAIGSAATGSYTLRHHLGSRLDPLWRSLSKAWGDVARDRGVREARRDLGHFGIIRAAEVTHGVHGWHPHLHPTQFFDRLVSESDVEQLHAEQVRAWTSAAARQGLDVLPVAQHLHRVTGDAGATLGDYFAKNTWAPASAAAAVAWEVTSTQTKTTSRAEGRTPWDLLNAVHLHGDADALDLWHAWEKGSKGKNALTWTRGLRKRLGVDVEQSDEDLAAAAVGTNHDVGLEITSWEPVRRAPHLGGRLLSVLAAGGWDAAAQFAIEHHIPHQRSPL